MPPGRYPLAEQLTIRVTRPIDELTTWEHLLIGQLLEEIKRIKRQVRKDT